MDHRLKSPTKRLQRRRNDMRPAYGEFVRHVTPPQDEVAGARTVVTVGVGCDAEMQSCCLGYE